MRRLMITGLAALAAGLGLAATSPQAAAQGSGSATLDAAKGRGQVLCGTAGTVPGFALPDSQGVMRGLDADECRAVAAAVLGDANKVKFVPLTTQNRFTALQSGEIDLLIREHHLDAWPRGESGLVVHRGQLITTAPGSW